MSEVSFELWLEFEHWERQEGDDPADDAFNMSIKLAGGEYALNVWTYKLLERVKRSDEESGRIFLGNTRSRRTCSLRD